MHDIRRMRCGKPGANLLGERFEPRPRHWLVAELARQWLAVDELHRQKLFALVFADVEHARDVAMLDPSRQLDLATKSFERVLAQSRAQHFECDAFIELGVERFVDAT